MTDKKFPIVIAAVDAFSQVFQKAINSVVSLNKPIEDTRKGLKKLDSEPAVKSISKQLDELGYNAKGAVSAVGALVPSIETLAGIGTLSGLALFTNRWVESGAAIQRTSQMIGVSTNILQSWQGAARLAGASADDANTSLGALATTMQNAEFGRDQNARAIVAQLGIVIQRTKEGAIDVDKALLDISATFDATRKAFGIQAATNLINQFGLGGLLPLLLKGQEGVKQLRAEWEKTGAVIDQAGIDRSSRLYEKFVLLGGAAEGFGNKLMKNLAPALETTTDWMTSLVTMAGQAQDMLAFKLGFVDGKPVKPTATSPRAQDTVTPFSSRGGGDVNDTLRQLGNRRGAFLREQFAPPVEGKVSVDIKLTGAPAGTVVQTHQTGQVNASASVETFMPTGGP